MPPKKSTTTAAKPASTKAQGPTYEDMIKDAILNLKERKGSSRIQLKKYVQANNKGVSENPSFDKLFNNALSKGVAKGLFAQPKGPSGSVKLGVKVKPDADDKKAAVGRSATKPAAAKPTTKKITAAAAKKAAARKAEAAAPKVKSTTPKKAAVTTKASAAKKTTPAKKLAAKVRPKKTASAPAVEDKPVVLGKTKGGRITKTTQKSAPPAAKKVAKSPAKSKNTPKKAGVTQKKATPKEA